MLKFEALRKSLSFLYKTNGHQGLPIGALGPLAQGPSGQGVDCVRHTKYIQRTALWSFFNLAVETYENCME